MNRPLLFKFIKFSLVGVANTLISLLCFVLFYRVFGVFYLISSFLGYTAGLINSYFWNLRWTFREMHSPSKLVKFIVVNLVAVSIKLFLLHIMITAFGWQALTGEIVAMVISIVINFSGNNFWVFKE